MNRPVIIITILFFLDLIALARCMFFDQPRLQTVDGHLFIVAAKDKNLTLVTSTRGYLNVNGINMVKAVQDAKRAAAAILNVKDNMITKLEDDIKLLSSNIENVGQRLNVCETLISNIPTTSNAGKTIKLQRRVTKLERQVRNIIRNLTKNECQNDPCQNGGSCLDRYLNYECRCPEGWEGKNCERDINECGRFAGTDLGCQNGATCVNKRGSYECICAAGWYGLHCTRRQNDCNSGPASELCGHGICVSQTSGTKGYSCICDQGWTTDGTNPACTVDVDECSIAPCSRNPPVTCHNIPGGFICGSCPPGYTGNGFLCTDVNECLVQNGGCSVQPMVSCLNTVGSFTCGPCPPGYAGDGKTCTYVGRCQANNGGCHPNARCQELGNNVGCQCLPGYTGPGFGINGCVHIPGAPTISSNPCIPNPCRYGGVCTSFSSSNFTCACPVGYSGRTCNIPRNPCLSNPCRNGGTCTVRRGRFFTCRCTQNFRGRLCDIERQRCGGILQSDSGELQFPTSNARSSRYSNNLSCAWIITVNHSLVINITFEQFDLESGTDCPYDWVQIHDGRTAADHLIGKFCGRTLPNNGTIVTTSNNIYMWFKSDSSTNRMGFKLKWNATAPACGGEVDASIHGTIKSPGSPGKYPPNRDCYWNVVAPYGKMIRFTFFEIDLESHQNCSYDYLFIHENLDVNSKIIGKYCSASVPEPLDSYGNAALVHFHSDQAGSGRGFQIAYHPIPGYPGCGGIYSARRGEIKPPTEDGKYIKGMDCVWIIRLAEDLRIKINFGYIDLEPSTSCYADFVEIRDGSDIYAPLIGKYCGNTVPAPITSNGNQLYVRFYADASVQLRGFQIRYNAICGQTFTDDNGIIQSPGYPTAYRDEEDCIFIIENKPGKAIEIEFQDFELEFSSALLSCFYDYLEIRDGHDNKSPLIGKFCGTNKPTKIVSSYNYLWMRLVTDASLSHRGFYANYTTLDVSCGGILKEPAGIIRSPIHSSDQYPPNHYCRWVIAGKPGEVISLSFTSFKMEYDSNCNYDFVAVYDNSSIPRSGGPMGKFCGNQVPPQLTTTDNLMTIVFRTDASFNLEGFTATYSMVNASTVCGGNYFTPTGVIRSPNYPRRYPNSKDCTWVIKVKYGRKVTLNIRDFQLETIFHRSCYDYLEIRDGAYETSPLIGTYCGSDIPKRVISQSNSVYLKFHSDSAVSDTGFYINWDSTINGCGGTLTGFTGTITSPNYPEPYGSNSDCNYKITVSAGSKVQLSFLDLELEDTGEDCNFDFLQIHDGPDKTSKLLGRYCSSNNHPPTLLSTGNAMFIIFRSDMLDARKGFYLKYRTVCNADVKGYQGIIESPNFPDTFPTPVDCTWTITAPMGNKINASFSHFNLGNNCDETFLEVKEGPFTGDATNLIGKYCDKKPRNNLIASSLQKLYIHFVTSDSFAEGNFRLEWVVNGCGGSFRKPAETFTSPNYPNAYPPNTFCEWFITVEPTSSIKLIITNINFETSSSCTQDYLEVYGGPDDTAPLLTRLCNGIKNETKIESSGNQMYVKFQSDVSSGGKGFFASYMSIPSKCGGRFLSNHGSIHSRNYPQNYERLDDCQWTIEVDATHRVNLTFIDFDIFKDEEDNNCTNNFVEVFDGTSIQSPSLLKHCGSTLPNPKTILSTSNIITVRMKSNETSNMAKGFLANYSIACGAEIIANEPGVIELNDLVSLVNGNHICSWIIISPEPDGHITLTLNQMDLNPGCSSSLSVFDRIGENSTLLNQYCGTNTPLPIVSRGNAIVLELQIQSSEPAFFKVTYSSASSSCGGELLSTQGQFATPNYPGSYPPKSECIWTISTSPGNGVQINFKTFDIANSEGCNEHYVEVRESGATGKLLGVYCGTTPPPTLNALSSVWIKFRSGEQGTGNLGFLADYSLAYGNELSGKSGLIANPGYPKPFIQSYFTFKWKVTVDFGKVIQIAFKKFHIDKYGECATSSTITIYDGVDNTAPVLVEACGEIKPEAITSGSNIVSIYFQSTFATFGSLFLLEWNEIEKPMHHFEQILPTSSVPGCGGFIDLTSPDNRSVSITSPGYPYGYSYTLNCTWIVECPEEEHLLLTIYALDIIQTPNCWQQYLTIYSGINGMSTWESKAKLCRNNASSTQYHTSNFMKLNFYSNPYVNGNRTGFSLEIEKDCGGSIKKSEGIIDFNWNFANNQKWAFRNWYERNYSCQWDITVTPGRTIKATFVEFNISSYHDGTCKDKYIILRNGATKDSPLLGTGMYCTEPQDIPSTSSNRMFIMIKTQFQSSTFKLRFEEESHNCGGTYQLNDEFNETIISSPNYPNIPPPKVECIWVFVTSGGHRLQIDFLERFDLASSPDCNIEYLELRDGGTHLSSEIGRYCMEKPSTQTSSGNMIYVKYFTNATDPKNGFKARVSLARCGGILRANNGFLMSPGYPNSYQYGLDCRWEIESELNYRININFMDLELPLRPIRYQQSDSSVNNLQPYVSNASLRSSFRYNPFYRVRGSSRRPDNCTTSATLIISEKAPPENADSLRLSYPSISPEILNALRPFLLRDRGDTIIGKICSNEMPQMITSSANRVVINFNSGTSVNNFFLKNYRGFKLNFTSTVGGCDQTISTASGIVASPNYPNERPSYYFCNWKITVPLGRRVTLIANDIDLVGSTMEQRITIYSDHEYRTRVAMITSSNAKNDAIYKSSSNKMMINFWSNTYSGNFHRGFRFTFNSDEPAICGGSISSDKGVITSPQNQSSFFCEWQFPHRWSENQTLTFTVFDSIIGNRTGFCNFKYASVLSISSLGDASDFNADICGNVSSITVRCPLSTIKLTALKSPFYGPFDFNVKYKLSTCGGIIRGTEAMITSPSYPNSYPQDMDCAWLIKFPMGMKIKITVLELGLEPSCSDFVTIKNGGSYQSPLMDEYCGTVKPDKFLVSEGSSVLVEFHSDSKNQGKGFKITFEPASSVCGGIIHLPTTEIMTPNFPSDYGNNQECEWEIRAWEGMHIGLIFVDRFHIETSENCKKDFVKIFDYVNNDWKEIKKLCGREFPSPINSTSARMKILFQSDGTTTSDGFKAKWELNCGGVFKNVEEGTIISPGYPNKYPNNIHCVYTFDYGKDYIYFSFSAFQLEAAFRGNCKYDSVEFFEMEDSVGKYCGTSMPGPRKLRSPVRIEFTTDSYNTGIGFAIDFKRDGCGGYINESKIIEFKRKVDLNNYYYYVDTCKWEIEAPAEMIVIVRLLHFDIPSSSHNCMGGLTLYEGAVANGKVIGRVCGNLNSNLPVFRSSTNKLSISMTRSSYQDINFSGSVIFSYGPDQGCGGRIDLGSNPETIQSPDINRDNLYEEFLDCSWLIMAKPFHYIIANFLSLDMDNCNITTSCSCDFVEIRDGMDSLSDVISKACGKTPPATITSSGNALQLRMATDGTFNAKGFTVQFSSQLSRCGYGILMANESKQILKSPNYPQNYPEGIRCTWIVNTDEPLHTYFTRKNIHIHVENWEIEDSNDCSSDYLSIEDSARYGTAYATKGWEVSRNKSSNATQVIRGKNVLISNSERITLCGSGTSIDFYSQTSEVTVRFVSNSGITKKGFQLEYSYATCNRNFTSPWGRIKQTLFANDSHCYITVAAPSSNHTISLYFLTFYMQSFGDKGCPKSYLEIRDGPNVQSSLVNKFCGYNLPDPIYSSGQYLWLHIYTEKGTPMTHNELDITYMTTDQGQGCGGRIHASSGVFTSPGYPNNRRQNSVCRWDILVPVNLVAELTFTNFEIGPRSTCETDYIEIFDFDDIANSETLVAKYCGSTIPAVIRTNTDATIIRYTTSIHNGGTGWRLYFNAVSKTP